MNVDRFEVHVDELDIAGFAPVDAAALATAFEHELTVLGRTVSIGEPTSVPRRRLQVMDIRGASASDVGIRSARAVFGELE
jgi:hypothetical protein